MTLVTAGTDRRTRPTLPGVRDTLAGVLAVAGLALSTVATSRALYIGEGLVTLLPFGPTLAAWGLPALVAARVAVTVTLVLVVSHLAPRHRASALAGAGLGWLGWGGWQFWRLLALT